MVTFKGNPLELAGSRVEKGQRAPDFRVQKTDMSDYTLASGKGKTRVIAAVLSLDTSVCSTEMQRFARGAAEIPGAEMVCVSMDLPMTQKRWCGAEGVDNVITASDHREASFGQAYGCLIRGGPLDRILARSVFVVGPDDTIRHVQYVDEVSTEPDYDAALRAAR